MPDLEITAGHAAFLQTATALVQAIVSLGLLTWYVLSARNERVRRTRERAEEFESLVMLCRGLGLEAQARTMSCRQETSIPETDVASPDQQLKSRVTGWKDDMEVIYVSLNEVPHYEVRNPSFSIALTRLWIEVDARAIEVTEFGCPKEFERFLEHKHARIGWEIDTMARLLTEDGLLDAVVCRPMRAPGNRAKKLNV